MLWFLLAVCECLTVTMATRLLPWKLIPLSLDPLLKIDVLAKFCIDRINIEKVMKV